MSYQARVFKVFIASPSDVAQERATIRSVLNRWNNINSDKYKIVLLPVGWETHSAPEVGSSPQKILNKQILEDADLLIGVFWTRFGTPTEDYESGTEEEIEEHIKTGKPTMLYFSNKPVLPDSIDEEQYRKVKAFKEKYQSNGIYHDYSDLEEFQQKLSDHIQLKINNHSYFEVEAKSSVINLSSEDDQIPNSLSEEAKILLKEGAQDNTGYIMVLKHLGGQSIQTNNKTLDEGKNPRTRAKWESAINELESHGLIESANYKRETFKITNKGYEIAELL